MDPDYIIPTQQEAAEFVQTFYGGPENKGWRVRLRHRFGYIPSKFYYQATLNRLVCSESRWLDVGAGKNVLPDAEAFARTLAERAERLVGVDPSENIDNNTVVHQRARCTLEEFRTEETFDLATLRMVAEHVEKPDHVSRALARLVHDGGHVVIYTPSRWAPASLLAAIIPDRWHPFFARFAAGGRKDEDVFPTCYRMNTRRDLRRIFAAAGFVEAAFERVPDCCLLQRWRFAYRLELGLWWLCHKLRLPYPENHLLGVYRKVSA